MRCRAPQKGRKADRGVPGSSAGNEVEPPPPAPPPTPAAAAAAAAAALFPVAPVCPDPFVLPFPFPLHRRASTLAGLLGYVQFWRLRGRRNDTYAAVRFLADFHRVKAVHVGRGVLYRAGPVMYLVRWEATLQLQQHAATHCPPGPAPGPLLPASVVAAPLQAHPKETMHRKRVQT